MPGDALTVFIKGACALIVTHNRCFDWLLDNNRFFIQRNFKQGVKCVPFISGDFNNLLWAATVAENIGCSFSVTVARWCRGNNNKPTFTASLSHHLAANTCQFRVALRRPVHHSNKNVHPATG